MKRYFFLLSLVAFSGLRISAQEKQPSARSLMVQVFSSHKLSSITMTPLGRSEQIRRCHTCRVEAVSAPFTAKVQSGSIVLSSGKRLQEAELSGAFRTQAAGEANEIEAAGVWNLTMWRGEMRLLLTLDSERYVAYALEGEAAPNEPIESLKAMAVAIRTYALENANRHSREGFNLCDSTHCQTLRFGRVSSQLEEAVLETAGETLWYHKQRAVVFYTQNCGGETEDARNVWPRLHAPYLISHPDPYCMRHSQSRWHAEIPIAQLETIFRNEGWKLPTHIEAIRILKRTAAGRAEKLEVSGSGNPVQVSASSFRFAVDRSLGWNQLRSDWYTATLRDGIVRFDGQGSGHGVGLCQAGAFEMAAEGHSYREILRFYFPGTGVGITPRDRGWQQTQGIGWMLWTAAPSAAMLKDGNAAWGKAQTLFPSHAVVRPVVRQFPTTELFRQSTSEPGWILASTRGIQIFLQPDSVLQRSRERGTLLHEFLHVLVEKESSPQTPLWLREGLVEALALDSTRQVLMHGSVEIKDLDAALAHPLDKADSQRAHADAALLTRELLSLYGLEQVRQWLRSGNVPDTVIQELLRAHQLQLGHSPSTPR